jgi:two-component system, OmpR family, sensor histidine kinase ArlS
MKIRNKLTYKFVIIVASILLLFSIAIYYFSALYREQEFRTRLEERGITTARLLIKVDEVDLNLLKIIDKNNLTSLTEEKITVYDKNKRKIYTSDDDPEIPVSSELLGEIRNNEKVYFNHDKKEVAGLLYREKNEPYVVIVSARDKFGINKLSNLRLVLIIGFIISIGVIFIAGYLFSWQALKSIPKIIAEVKRITASNMHVRLEEGNAKDELALLSITFNQMLGRLEQAFEVQKSFVSNASHELRTPLSTINAQLDFIAIQDREKSEYKNIIKSVREDIKSLIRLSNGLLDLAQVESDLHMANFKTLRIDELIFEAISDISKKYPSQKINFKIEDEEKDYKGFLISGNESLLRTAFFNIIDNACKYSNNNLVNITMGFVGNEIMISCIDEGIGIPPNDLPYIFDPFYRGDKARNISGHGIGLSLAQKIVALHQGKIKVFSETEGTTVIIAIPNISMDSL